MWGFCHMNCGDFRVVGGFLAQMFVLHWSVPPFLCLVCASGLDVIKFSGC